MIPISFIICCCLTSVLCLNCSDVLSNTKGFGIFTKRNSKGSQIYKIYDKNGKEWQFFLKKLKELDIDWSYDESQTYNESLSYRFSTYSQVKVRLGTLGTAFIQVLYDCNMWNKSWIHCNVLRVDSGRRWEWTADIGLDDPLIMKRYPSKDKDVDAAEFIAISKLNKSKKKLKMLNFEKGKIVGLWKDNWEFNTTIKVEDFNGNIFLDQMNDTLFSQIDSIADYNWDHKKGHILWFNMNGKHYYCFQPEGQNLSQQCLDKKNLKEAFKDCYPNSRQTTPKPNTESSNYWLIIAVIAIITVVVIGVIVGLVFAYKPRNENQSNRYKTAIGSNISSYSLSQTESGIKPSTKTELSDISVLNDRPNELRIRSETQKKGFDQKDNQRSSIGTAISNPNSIYSKNGQMKRKRVMK